MSQWTIDQIWHELDEPGRRYPRAAVDAAVERREEITPRLLAFLEELAADPEGWLDAHPVGMQHYFTLVLLSHFQEARAHDLALRLAALPEETIDWLLGDFALEDLSLVLARTCDGRTDGIERLVTDPEVWGYVRCEAANALAMLAVDGRADRDRVGDLLASQLSPDSGPRDSYHWTGFAKTLIDLRAARHRAAIEAAMDAELVEPIGVGRGELADALSQPGPWGPRHQLERAEETKKDIHAWMSWWAAFRPRPSSALLDSDGPGRAPVNPAKKAKAKAARKAAKKARQKSRKRKK